MPEPASYNYCELAGGKGSGQWDFSNDGKVNLTKIAFSVEIHLWSMHKWIKKLNIEIGINNEIRSFSCFHNIYL